MLKEIGIDLARGWLYGKPFPASELETELKPLCQPDRCKLNWIA
jgi:EAL domain-containing protein (putative c-di-GMP-specific phosphodiesterase class I)